MGKDACDQFPIAKAAFDEANAALADDNISISKLCFEGPDESLKLTENTQPCILTTSVALYRAFTQTTGVKPDVAIGHSLGEYSAHVAAGTFSLADGVRLVRNRGKFMQEAVPVGQGAMAAVLKAEPMVLENICSTTTKELGLPVEPVNYNGPGQIVIAGSAVAVSAASDKLKTAGARVMPLPVSAPFHSSLMRPAQEKLSPFLKQLHMQDPRFPIMTNVDAKNISTASEAVDTLTRQVSAAVRFEASVLLLVEQGVQLFVEIGPGTVLTGLIKRITEKAKTISVQSPADFDGAKSLVASVLAT